jgi:hypothetical protein
MGHARSVDRLIEPKAPFGELFKGNLQRGNQSEAKVASYLCTTATKRPRVYENN